MKAASYDEIDTSTLIYSILFCSITIIPNILFDNTYWFFISIFFLLISRWWLEACRVWGERKYPGPRSTLLWRWEPLSSLTHSLLLSIYSPILHPAFLPIYSPIFLTIYSPNFFLVLLPTLFIHKLSHFLLRSSLLSFFLPVIFKFFLQFLTFMFLSLEQYLLFLFLFFLSFSYLSTSQRICLSGCPSIYLSHLYGLVSLFFNIIFSAFSSGYENNGSANEESFFTIGMLLETEIWFS